MLEGAPLRTCSHDLPMGSGRGHHGSYPPSDDRLSLVLLDSQNSPVQAFQPKSIYRLVVTSTEAYTGYLFGSFDSASKSEVGFLDVYSDENGNSKGHIVKGGGCVTQGKKGAYLSTAVTWTSPEYADVSVDLQAVVTFSKGSSLISLKIEGDGTAMRKEGASNNSKSAAPYAAQNYGIYIFLSILAVAVLAVIAVPVKNTIMNAARLQKVVTSDRALIPKSTTAVPTESKTAHPMYPLMAADSSHC
jgi:hypothetical protein